LGRRIEGGGGREEGDYIRIWRERGDGWSWRLVDRGERWRVGKKTSL